ncbi:hypothetical protein DLAC_08969 [Tieghemostelium lacteum]|uniref:MACPF domain-containing protein n=1 Tax=Tieghemostelium lacteum TaxID=361077 RepID=A0A151Z915_TIELA|nr:hypothetical protein DLAC_08969 [Tieghemostelium lacteum]|eukprot:KYQ90354.1 hypothetical protein DLAC_08969 [Tieghemostelium lacteum]
MINIKYYIVIFALLLLNINAQLITDIYVGQANSCVEGPTCGTSASTPFPSLYYAIELAKSSYTPTTIITIKDGTYTGFNNHGLVLSSFKNTNLQIRSTSGTASTVTISCGLKGQWMRIEKSNKVTLLGLTIKDCTGNQGGAIYLDRSDLVLRSMVFESNSAFKGGALYSNSSKSIVIKNTKFQGNSALEQGSSLFSTGSKVLMNAVTFNANLVKEKYDSFACESSDIQIDGVTNLPSTPSVSCGASCVVSINQDVICHRSNNTLMGFNKRLLSSTPQCLGEIKQSCSNCNENSESCATCSQCACYQSGFLMDIRIPSTNCVIQRDLINFETDPVDLLSDYSTLEISGTLKGYIRVKKASVYSFAAETSNLGIEVKLDAKTILKSQQTRFSSLSNITSYLVPDLLYTLKINIKSAPLQFQERRSLRFISLDDQNVEIFYSNLACGERLTQTNYDLNHPCTTSTPLSSGVSTCGDGFCDEMNQNSCFQDCYHQLSERCESRKVPSKHISPGFFIEYSDTIGNLIDNQMIWHLPGSEHFQTGIDIVNGKSGKSPLFYFGYCTDESENLLQDVYRRTIYELPDELSGKVLPQCTFSTQTKTYHSLEEIRKESESASTASFSASIGGGWGGWGASGSAAYSQDTSMKQAQSITTESTKTFFVSEVSCSISSVEMVKTTFHPTFLKDLSKVNTLDQMYQLILKYGTHYIKTAKLGGTLKTITTTEEVMQSEEHEAEWTESVKLSASVSFKTPVLSGGLSAGATNDNSQSVSQHEEKESKSSRTSVIVKGGAPGSYGPDSGSLGTMFEDWADSIDLLPVPINQNLYPIASLIPVEWKIGSTQTTIRSLWIQAEQHYYDLNQYSNTLPNKYAFYFSFTSFTNANVKALPVITIEWTSPQDNTKRTTVVRTPHVQVMGPNQESIEFIPDFSYVDTSNRRTIKVPHSDWYTNTGFYSTGNGYINVQESYSVQVKSPLRYDITLAEDFMSSTTEPVFTITNLGSFSAASYRIINMKTSKAIVLTKTGAITKDTYIYIVLSGQLKNYGGVLAQAVQDKIPTPANSSITLDQLLIAAYGATNIVRDLHKINFGFEGETLTSTTNSFGYYKAAVLNAFITYHTFIFNDSRPDLPLKFVYEHQDMLGSNKRLNYLLALRPIKGNTWLRDVVSYHTRSDNYAFTKLPLTLKLEPIQPENSGYYFYARNNLRYLPIHPTSPNYLPIGKYPITPDPNLQFCQTVSPLGQFYDFTPIFINDLNETNHVFINMCGRSLSCVEHPSNVAMEPEIRSCFINQTSGAMKIYSKSDEVPVFTLRPEYGVEYSFGNLEPGCSGHQARVRMKCWPESDEVKVFHYINLCEITTFIHTKYACPPSVYYDNFKYYYYNLTALLKPSNKPYSSEYLPGKKIYYNIGGKVKLCDVSGEDQVQACMVENGTITSLGILTRQNIIYDIEGNGLTIQYGLGTPIAFLTRFTLHLVCSHETTFQNSAMIWNIPQMEFYARVDTSYACGTPFNPYQQVPGLPSWYRFAHQ